MQTWRDTTKHAVLHLTATKKCWLHGQVAREGTKKTVFTNYLELCKAMNRPVEHVQLFLMAELGTSGSLDGQQRLICKGRFQPKAFEGVLRRYANECVPRVAGPLSHTLEPKSQTP